jgi:phytol kinase
MLQTILVVLVTFCVLIYSEWLARAKQIHAELTRKFVHITVGTFVAFWPFFLNWSEIELLSLAFFVVVALSIKYNVFRSIHAVKRNIIGELMFAVIIGLLAVVCSSKWVFMAAMLNLSLADGLAAIVGIGWGESNTYKVFGHTKSRAGTAAFFVSSLCIMIVYGLFAHSGISFLTILWLPVLATVAENISVEGTDNFVVPMLIALVLISG